MFMGITHEYLHRPDLLSYMLYKTPEYWWVFMRMNMDLIRDPIWDFTAGTVIRVPTLERLKSMVG